MTTIVSLQEIKAAVHLESARAAIAEGFIRYSEGSAVIPPVAELLFEDPPGDVHIKYGYIGGDEYFAIKVACGFYDNPHLGLPAQDGVVLVHERRTGRLVCVLLDQGWLTDLRTALAGAVVAARLAPSKVSCIGVLGTGLQARLQVEHLRGVVDCSNLLVWGRSAASTSAYLHRMRELGYQAHEADTPGALIDCELIVTTTPAAAPLLTDVKPGTHITAVGADTHTKNELAPQLFGLADLVVADSIIQCSERGELRHALKSGVIRSENVVELGSILAGAHAGRTDDQSISIADLTGVAVQDIRIAEHVLHRLTQEQP